jgi:DeoR family glycerol-3-phosphate regulon repressor
MDLNPRQLRLLETVRARGSVLVDQLAGELGVSLQTIRRDVQRLSDSGTQARFHGGVRLPGSTTENLAHRQRQALHAESKRRIAAAIARDVPDGCALLINIGTTTEAVAQALLQRQNLRVITNNLNVAMTLSGNPTHEVIVAGGAVRGRDRGVVGGQAVDFIRQFRVDIGIIGISGIEADGSLRDYDLREVQVAQAVIRQSREVWLAADASKFNRPAMVEVARLDQIDRLYTNAAPLQPFAELLEAAGVLCEVCE